MIRAIAVAVKNKALLSVSGALIITLVAGGWYLNRVLEQRDTAIQDVSQFENALEVTTNSFDQLWVEFQTLQGTLSQREQERNRLREENRQLAQELKNEQSEEFNACYDVELSDDYVDRLQQQSRRDTDESR